MDRAMRVCSQHSRLHDAASDLVCVCFQDEGSFQMKRPARELLRDMGSDKAETLSWRDMWAMVTVKAGTCTRFSGGGGDWVCVAK